MPPKADNLPLLDYVLHLLGEKSAKLADILYVGEVMSIELIKPRQAIIVYAHSYTKDICELPHVLYRKYRIEIRFCAAFTGCRSTIGEYDKELVLFLPSLQQPPGIPD